MLFWHVGATIGFVRYAFRDTAMDLRFLALGAVLPDLIDTPIGAVAWSTLQTTRLWAHTILFGSTLLVAVLVGTRRGRRRKQWMLLATGVLLHLVLDGLWNQPDTLWWPFLGTTFTPTGFATYGAYVADVLTDPVMWLGEGIGLVYLIGLWRKAGLDQRDARERLLTEGTVSATIG